VQRLPAPLQHRARLGGLALAMVTRIALLFSIVLLTHLVQPWLRVAGVSFSGRDVVLLLGGLFLLAKSVLEIHQTLEGAPADAGGARLRGQLLAVIVQIGLIDIVFSLDSVFTAVGLVRELPIMVAAIVVAIVVMMWVVGSDQRVHRALPDHQDAGAGVPAADRRCPHRQGLHFEIPKGYLYFAMLFAVAVEMINVRLRRRLEDRER